MTKTVFRVHPTVNFARFGTSEDYILSPESSAGLPQKDSNVTGGLPLKKDTPNQPVTSKDLRDKDGNLKKQAARFRIYAYEVDENGQETYPSGKGQEVIIGSTIGGKKVKDLVWSSHLANKKAAFYNVEND
ncbi:MAG: LodA/GoxA family CTQ-dependent oxidase, partial [Colwellia sp.]